MIDTKKLTDHIKSAANAARTNGAQTVMERQLAQAQIVLDSLKTSIRLWATLKVK